jgi:hypothetical protein
MFSNVSEKFTVGGILMRLISQVLCNSHDILDGRERIGQALYTSASLTNHTCDPSLLETR